MKDDIEEMSNFFNLRANDYDNYMIKNIDSVDMIYSKISDPIKNSNKKIEIVDFGCGTGLELKSIFEKVPNVLITGIDISEKMVKKLIEKYSDKKTQLNIIIDSYLNLPLEKDKFDYAISVMSMHHFLHETKVEFYKKVHQSLKPRAKYIEGDYTVTTLEEEKQFLDKYSELVKAQNIKSDLYHIDIPFTLNTQISLFKKAGFQSIDIIWRGKDAAIFVCEK